MLVLDCVSEIKGIFPIFYRNSDVRFRKGYCYRCVCNESTLSALSVRGSERPRADLRHGGCRCTAASPKQMFDKLCSIFVHRRSGERTSVPFAAGAKTYGIKGGQPDLHCGLNELHLCVYAFGPDVVTAGRRRLDT